MFKEGQKLWSEATPIPFYQHHPVQRWCRHRNLFPGYKELPPTIRWHEQSSLIIVALASMQDFIDTVPEPPQPRQFHLISIDNEGRKGKAFKGEDKRTWGRPGVTCVAMFGDPNASEINICEGIADALAILGREEGAVIASITTFNKLTRCETLMEYLTASGRTVTIFGDNDTAGRDAQEKLASTLHDRGGKVFYYPNPTAKDPAEAAANGGEECVVSLEKGNDTNRHRNRLESRQSLLQHQLHRCQSAPSFKHFTREEELLWQALGKNPMDGGDADGIPAFTTSYLHLEKFTGEFPDNGQPPEVNQRRMWSTLLVQCEICNELVAAHWVDRWKLTAGYYCDTCHKDYPLTSYLQYELNRKPHDSIVSEYQGYLKNNPDFQSFQLWVPGKNNLPWLSDGAGQDDRDI